MGTYTPNLNLYNTNMLTDGNDLFSFDRDISENNTKIDTAFGKIQTNQDINVLTSGTISLENNISFHKRVISDNTTFTFDTTNLSLSNVLSYTFELCIEMSTAKTLTFPSNVKWQDSETPDMTNTGTYFFAFRTIDSGTSWKGSLQGVWQ